MRYHLLFLGQLKIARLFLLILCKETDKVQIGLEPDNLRILDLIKQYYKSERIIGLMIGVGAKKAFDSVDHNYMQGVLETYGFGPKFKNWFKLL